MDPVAFSLAVLALLATPGPTNTLLATSGAAVGVRKSLRLMPAAIGGYLISITALAALAAPIVAQHPWVLIAVKLVVSLWLALCAVRLWRGAGSEFTAVPAMHISLRQMFVTTLLNPKVLILALGIFPQGPLPLLTPWLAGFSGLVLCVSVAWIGLGAAAAHSAGPLATPSRIWRAAALGLAVFATIIAGSAFAAAF